MPAAAQWRIVGVRSYGGRLELGALHLLDGSGRIDQGAVLTCSHAPAQGILSDLQSAGTGAVVAFGANDVASAGFAITWKFSAAVDVRHINIFSGDVKSAFIGQFDFEYFDGSQWVRVATMGWFEWPGVRSALAVDARGVSYDPQLYFVKSLLHFDGVDGSTFIEDATGRPWNAAGTAKLSTANAKFGSASVYVASASNSNYVQTADSPDIRPGADPYTVEFFYRPLSLSNWRSPFQKGTWNSAGGLTMIVGSSSIKVSSNGTDSGDISHGLTAGSMSHMALCRDVGNTARVFVNGKLRGSFYQPQNLNGTSPLQLFAGGGIIAPDAGWIDEFRFTVGFARYTAEFDPPEAPFPDASQAQAPLQVRASSSRVAHSSEVPQFCVSTQGKVLIARDVEFGGRGRLYGTVAIKGTPSNTPVARRVRLLRSRDSLLARETWSKPDGSYLFDGINEQYDYDVVVFDHELNYFSQVANNKKPEVA